MSKEILFEISKFSGASVFFTDRRKILDLETVIKNLPRNSLIIIREYDLSFEEREIFARKIMKQARFLGHKILIGKDIALAKKLKADGLHFSDFDQIPMQFLQKRFWPKNFIFSLAAHSYKTFFKLQKLKPNLLFISPIFSSTSHPNTKNFGLRNLAKIAFKTKNQSYLTANIYALGGINLKNIKSIQNLPISGFGAIDFFKKI
jgi:thiamine-phosphate pyrophosphorylase